MATRDLPVNEFMGWEAKADVFGRCLAAVDAGDTPDPVKGLCRSVLAVKTNAELPAGPAKFSVLAAADVQAIADGLLAVAFIDQAEYDGLIALLDVPSDAELRLAVNVLGRDREAADYQHNADVFAGLLADLEASLAGRGVTEWPDSLADYRNQSKWPRDRVCLEVADDATCQLVLDLQYRDTLRGRRRAELLEKGRVAAIRSQVYAMLPADRAEAIIAAAKALRAGG